jgi:hypothetical protein
MKLLVLDHFFAQDIESLRKAAGAHVDLHVVDYDLFRSEALRIFPPDVAGPLEAFARPEYAEYRNRFETTFGELLEDLFTGRPFDAFVAPSDVFFYLRPAARACHRLGIPFFVAQKETTISELTMTADAERVRAFAPPIADHMTVCSERHREFQLRAGAVPDRVTVTGQPRFDFYARPEEWPTRNDDGRPVVLFFSYLVDAYHPAEGSGRKVWADLHHRTELGLWELARSGWRVLVKPHPQQNFRSERTRIAKEVGELLDRDVFLVRAEEDARRLIVTSDVVVGFQSTALLEGMLVGRPVVYTGWDIESSRLSAELIPFPEWADVIRVVTRPEELAETIVAAVERGEPDEKRARREGIVTEYLGPFDGRASRRTLEEIQTCVESFEGRRDTATLARRAELAARRPPVRVRRRTRRAFVRLRRAAGEALGR